MLTLNDNNTLTMHIQIPKFYMTDLFNMTGLSNWVNGKGQGFIDTTSFKFDATGGLKIVDNKPNMAIDFVYFNLTNDTVKVEINGTNDWITLVNMTLKTAMPFAVKELNGVMPQSLLQ